MVKYKFLALTFLYIVIATSFASILGVNVQSIYRVPFISIRWIDVAILTIIFIYFNGLQFKERLYSNDKLIIRLCYVFLLFLIAQLIRSWHITDINSQVSHFICNLSIFIIIDLLTFKIDPQDIVLFIKKFAILGSFVLIFSNFFTLYSFISGGTIFSDSDIRVALNVAGEKESVYKEGLIALVYVFGLYIFQNKSKIWEKVVFITAILSIYVSLVYSFGRGLVFMIASITIIYVLVFSKKLVNALIQVFIIILLLVMFYFLFGNTLRQKGYDPIQRISEIIKYSVDVDNPDWDKGRSFSRKYAIDAWKESIWTGYGYDDLSNHGLPSETGTAHNFIVTSLFHNGIIGTFIYLLILLLLFRNSIKLWPLLSEHNYSNDIMKLLVISSFFWIIPAWTQEAFWEKHSLTIQFMYMGLISNYYKQKIV
jgi:hypothetical protein